MEFTLPGETSDLHLVLLGDNSVQVLDAPEGNPTGELGTWTMIYDQSILLELPDRGDEGSTFMANWRYTIKAEIESQRNYNHLTTGSYEAFDSDCGQTLVGVKMWKSGEDSMIQCW